MKRRWHPIPASSVPGGTILFDGVCVLCSWWVRFIIVRDPDARFRFTPIQSPYGRILANAFGIDYDAPESNAVVLDGTVFFKSDAAIHALQSLPHWQWVGLLASLPRPLRDWLYDRIARNRYRLFGRMKNCLVPSADIARRFVELPPKQIHR
jgi:predicted DCC family thiol-disulfide oxidoreductase YuxK